MMEYWNVGILGLVEWDRFFIKDGTVHNIKSDHHPLSIPNIPLFHNSIIPSCHLASKVNATPLG
jgi:hypothetical protein